MLAIRVDQTSIGFDKRVKTVFYWEDAYKEGSVTVTESLKGQRCDDG